MRAVGLAVLLVLINACAPQKHATSDYPVERGIVVPADLTADEAKVIATARQFLSTNQNWPDAKFERPRRGSTGGWYVLIWKLPATPELDMNLWIDDAGNVTSGHIGLGDPVAP